MDRYVTIAWINFSQIDVTLFVVFFDTSTHVCYLMLIIVYTYTLIVYDFKTNSL